MIVWAGNHDLTVAFADAPADNLLTGVALKKKEEKCSKMNNFFFSFLSRRCGDEGRVETSPFV